MENIVQETYQDLRQLAYDLKNSVKKNIILFAHNGVGKTSLSVEFKNIAKEFGNSDTLYYNAFTEDLFYWDNDLENDEERVLMLRKESHFFDGLDADVLEARIRANLARYADFDFSIKFDVSKKDAQGKEYLVNYVTFRRIEYDEMEKKSKWRDDIKISRGEENIFKWCFFLSIAQLAIDKADAYKWVEFIYIDDPISSLDDNNSILVANHLASLIKQAKTDVHTIISTHHGLFYNVICNELKPWRLVESYILTILIC